MSYKIGDTVWLECPKESSFECGITYGYVGPVKIVSTSLTLISTSFQYKAKFPFIINEEMKDGAIIDNLCFLIKESWIKHEI